MKYSPRTAAAFAVVLASVFFIAYAAWFGGINHFSLSRSPADWGQFGSYMAGTAGVAFALATVWMLSETLRLQITELKLTKAELKRSSDALEKQVNISLRSARSEKNYYMIKVIDENIESISGQHLNHNNMQSLVGSIAYSFDHFELGQYQLEQIAAQYMHLMYIADSAKTIEEQNEILDLAQPMIYKNKAMLLKLYEAKYFEKYSSSVKSLGFSQVLFENLEYEIAEIESSRAED